MRLKLRAKASAIVLLLAIPLLDLICQLNADATLDPGSIPKFAEPLIIPPAMPKTGSDGFDYYEIAVRQFQQQVLPAPLPRTTVWGYGSINHTGSFNYPAFTIEARSGKPVRVKWINGLVDDNGDFLPHLLPVDQTLHWANPPGPRDSHGMMQEPYAGPVPMVPHLHGSHVADDSDGYTEAWFLPAARNIPDYINFTVGSWYDTFKAQFAARWGVTWEEGTAVFQYPNDQRATTMWYHDHALGMTRLNVYAGPAGFYNIRGGDSDLPDGILPGPAPQVNDASGMVYYEIPIVIQDRSFNTDGSLFYPADRAFFEDLTPANLRIPFIPDVNPLNGLMSDVPPIWNPEFFGDTIVVNGKTWPYLGVEPRRYRFRFLNGCNSRFLILKCSTELSFWQIGADGGFLPGPVELEELIMGPAERADVIMDFTGIPKDTEIILTNIGPDEPFGGGTPGVDFTPADPATTGKVMKFVVVDPGPHSLPDTSTPPDLLILPEVTPLGNSSVTRQLSLNEEESETILVASDGAGSIVLDPSGIPFGPTMALLGTFNLDGTGNALKWAEAITENPAVGATETWEIHNFTMDAHPIHVHMVQFSVVDRTPMGEIIGGSSTKEPEPWETGFKDTVIAYPGEVTRIKALFDLEGLYVWHCHILEHEDNEMMRPYSTGDNVRGLSVVPSTNRAIQGGKFSLEMTMTDSIKRPFDFYLVASFRGAIFTISPRGNVSSGIKALFKKLPSFTGPVSFTIWDEIEVPRGLNGTITFYAAAVEAGKVPPVTKLDQLNPNTQNVIAFDRAEVNIRQAIGE